MRVAEKMALSNSNQRMEIRPASHFNKPRKSGQLKKLTRRGWLYRGPWKSRFCVLDGTKLYFYENEQSKGTERTSGVLNLDYFDSCEEGKQKDKRASNIFVVSTSVSGIFDRQTRHFFSADTLPEMNEWIHHIRKAIADARNNRSRAGRSKGGTLESLQRMPSQESNRSRASSTSEPKGKIQGQVEEPQPKQEHRELSPQSSVDSRLYTPTKNRAKGPTGRRLPQRKSMLNTNKMDDDSEFEDQNGPHRAQSMSALECINESESADHSWIDNSLELATTEGRSASQNALVYKYSSSDDSLDLPEEGRVKKLSKMLKIPTAIPTSTPGTPGMIRDSKMTNPGSHDPNGAPPTSPHRLPSTYNRGYQVPESTSPRFFAPSSPSRTRTAQVDNSPVLVFTRQLTSLDTKLHGLEQEMVVTRSDLASVHGGVGKVQNEVDRLTQRLERFATQFYQVEKQMATMLNEAQKFYEESERNAKETAMMKEQYTNLERELRNTLLQFQQNRTAEPASKSLAKQPET